jgi:hypothetical protein
MQTEAVNERFRAIRGRRAELMSIAANTISVA